MKTITLYIDIELSKKNYICDTALTQLTNVLNKEIKKIAQPVRVAVTWRRDDEEV